MILNNVKNFLCSLVLAFTNDFCFKGEFFNIFFCLMFVFWYLYRKEQISSKKCLCIIFWLKKLYFMIYCTLKLPSFVLKSVDTIFEDWKASMTSQSQRIAIFKKYNSLFAFSIIFNSLFSLSFQNKQKESKL